MRPCITPDPRRRMSEATRATATPPVLLGQYYRRHSTHSGYARLADAIPEAETVLVDQSCGCRRGDIVWRGLTWLARRGAGTRWLTLAGLRMEAAAAARMVRRRRRCVFHLLYSEAGFAWAARWARRTGHMCVATFHAPPSLMDAILRRPQDLSLLDGVVLVGSSQVPYFEAHVRNRDAIVVIPHGVDTDYFTPLSGPPNEGFTCLSVGTFLRDYDLLGRVADAVADDPRIRFLIVATPESTRRLHDRPNVICLSGLSDDDLLTCYRHADAFVLTAHDVTANNALLEAMACGLPIISEDVGSVRDYVRTDHAVLCRRNDAEGIVRAIRGLVARPEARRGMATAARCRAIELSWPRIALRILDMYDEIERRFDRTRGHSEPANWAARREPVPNECLVACHAVSDQ